MPEIVFIAIPLIVLIVLLKVLFRVDGRYKEERQARIAELGITRTTVERDCPYPDNRNRKTILRHGPCTEYRLEIPGYPYRWKLLMRFDRDDPRVENFWLVETDGVLPGRLAEALRKIKARVDEGFLELEGDERGVAAYLDEWGGAKEVDRIYGFLRSVSDGL